MNEHPVLHWFTHTMGWTPFPFQQQTWDAYAQGDSGLIHAPTGMGKSYAAWLGPLMQWCDAHPDRAAWPKLEPPPLTVLWITPLRALAADTAQTLAAPVTALDLPWTVELRTGDVAASVKARQRLRLPSALVTTPESLSLLLSYPDARDRFSSLRCVVVDEWHELMSTKRGTQTELGLARLRNWNPALQTWGMSATLGNLEQARDVLMGVGATQIGDGVPPLSPPREKTRDEPSPHAPTSSGRHTPPADTTDPQGHYPPQLIVAHEAKSVEIDTILPTDVTRFPWAGHLGIHLLQPVLDRLEAARSTLLFTNTRSQAEIWFSRITAARPDWIGEIALHHGSIDRDIREQVEQLLRAGRLRCVVCTSSLDLGVDFSPVDQVIQVGSPKGVARLMQRAGRSGHQPGAVSRVVGVPAHAFELIEFAAAREAAAHHRIESRLPLAKPLDVLVQHLVTCAMGGGFVADDLYHEIRTTWAFRNLTDQEWDWALDFVVRGGPTLTRYPQYARVIRTDGQYHVASPQIARMHRLAIGTITSSSAVNVKYQRGRTLGSVEEGFIAHLKPGDTFYFGGQLVELIRVRNMTAEVRRAKRKSGTVPTWQGGKSPLSTQLADAVRRKISRAQQGHFDDPELRTVQPLLELQRRWSVIPAADQLLIESLETADGYHEFCYPFQGRLVHEGLGALLAFRLTRDHPRSVTVNANDYGLELLCDQPLNLTPDHWRSLLSERHLLEDLLDCLNASELARRQFRDIARVAGLISQGFPGQTKTARHLQASSELFYDVFSQFDPENLLLDQARREVLEQQLELRRMKSALLKIQRMNLLVKTPEQLTPLSFPLWAESLREQHVTSESWEDRVRKMAVALERTAARNEPAFRGTAQPR